MGMKTSEKLMLLFTRTANVTKKTAINKTGWAIRENKGANNTT